MIHQTTGLLLHRRNLCCAKDFLLAAFKIVDLDWKDFVVTSKKYFRPNEVDYLLGNPKKIKEKLGWEPEVNFNGLVKMMVENDLNDEQLKRSLH